MSQNKKPEIAPDYYLANYKAMLGFVQQQYQDLFTDNETSFLETFLSLDADAQKLYVRLISRTGPQFRSDKLRYAEIDDIEAAADSLSEEGFLAINPDIELEAFADLITKAELLKWFPNVFVDRHCRKPLLVEQLLEADPELPELPFEIYEPLCFEEALTMQFMFFGNLHQDLTEFVLQELGLNSFESYPLSRDNRLFRSREGLEAAFQLSVLSMQVAEADYERDSDTLLGYADEIPEPPANPVLYRRYCRMVNRVAREFERQGQLERALELFSTSSLPPARERSIRILEKLGKKAEGIKLCEEILNLPASDLELEFAERFIKKLRGQKYRQQKHGLSEVQVDLEDSGERVELQVLEYYQRQGWQAFYVENTLMNGLAGLYFWEEIFADIPGAFYHPFQDAPSDLMTPDFYLKRKELLDGKLSSMNQSYLEHKVLSSFNDRRGVSNRLVNWKQLDYPLLELAVKTMPVSDIKAILSRLIFNLAHNRNGFPDLILFNSENKSYRWVEVKGPGDKLQKNQIRWLTFFAANQIPCEVVYVEWKV